MYKLSVHELICDDRCDVIDHHASSLVRLKAEAGKEQTMPDGVRHVSSPVEELSMKISDRVSHIMSSLPFTPVSFLILCFST